MARPLHARTHPGLDVPDCFGCKAASTTLKFTYSQEMFHDTTIKEFVDETRRDSEANGYEIQTKTRWV